MKCEVRNCKSESRWKHKGRLICTKHLRKLGKKQLVYARRLDI